MPEPKNFKKQTEIGLEGVTFCLARVPDSQTIYFGNSEAAIGSLDFAAEKPEPVWLSQPFAEKKNGEESSEAPAGHTSYVTGCALIGDQLITAGWDRRLIWWEPETGKVIRRIDDAHEKWLRGVTASPDGKQIATVSDDMVCRLWDAASGKAIKELRGHAERTPTHFPSMLFCSAFSPDGRRLATADKVGHVVIWDVESGQEIASLDSPENYTWDPRAREHSIGGVRSLAFSPDGKRLAVGGIGQIKNVDHLGSGGLVHIYEWETGKQLHRFQHEKHKGLVEQLIFAPKDDWLLAAGGGNGGFLFYLDPQTGKMIADEDAKFHVHASAVDESGESIYAVGHGKAVLWRA